MAGALSPGPSPAGERLLFEDSIKRRFADYSTDELGLLRSVLEQVHDPRLIGLLTQIRSELGRRARDQQTERPGEPADDPTPAGSRLAGAIGLRAVFTRGRRHRRTGRSARSRSQLLEH
jgi:hypothetical protein